LPGRPLRRRPHRHGRPPPQRPAPHVFAREVRQAGKARQDPHGRRGARRHRLGRAGAQLQCQLRRGQEAGRLHHQQVRHRGRHGGHAGLDGPRHGHSGRVLGHGAALQRFEDAERVVGDELVDEL
ncbi:hypothetical protein SLS54_001743, partial [Diplodia seriata]